MFEQVFTLSIALLTLYVTAYTFAAQQVAQRYSPRWLEFLRRPYAVAPLAVLSGGVAVAGYALLFQEEWKRTLTVFPANSLSLGIGLIILITAVVWILGLWDSLFDVESPKNLRKILSSDELLYDVLFAMLSRRDRVLWARLLKQASTNPEWVDAIHHWLKDTPEALKESWLIHEAVSELSRELQPGQADDRWEVLGMLMDASLRHGSARDALDHFEMVMLHLSVMKVWDNGHWNIMTTLAESFWHDPQGRPRLYASDGEKEEIQHLVTRRLERICDVMLQVRNINVLNEYMEGIGSFIRDVADEDAVALASHLVQKEGLFEVVDQRAYQEFLNGLNFARKGPRAAYECHLEDRWRFVDGIVDSVLLVAQHRFEEGVVRDLAETGGMRWANGRWHSAMPEPSLAQPLPIKATHLNSLMSFAKRIAVRSIRKK